MTYEVHYNTGAGDKYKVATLEDAKQTADKGAAYTQTDIVITTDDGVEVCRRRWYGVAPDDTDLENDIIVFGDSGFYDAWTDD